MICKIYNNAYLPGVQFREGLKQVLPQTFENWDSDTGGFCAQHKAEAVVEDRDRFRRCILNL